MTPSHVEGVEGRMCEHTPCTKSDWVEGEILHTERGWGDGVKNSRAKLEWARQEQPTVQRDWGDRTQSLEHGGRCPRMNTFPLKVGMQA